MGRVFVAGSINMDVVATATRHPRIGETVAGEAVLYFPGGKGANQAVASAKLGAPTTLIGRIGLDAFGHELRAFLQGQGIDLSFLRESPQAHSGTALITTASANNTIVVISGANALLGAADVAAVVLAKGDIAVSQFEIPMPTIVAFFDRARAAGARTILNPAPAISFGAELFDLTDVLVLNESELGFLASTGIGAHDAPSDILDIARRLPAGKNTTICVTLGERGAVALVNGEPLIVAGRPVKAVDTTGAGDCFVGAIAAQLANGKPMADALAYANIAASISVQRMGAAPSMPTAVEVAALQPG